MNGSMWVATMTSSVSGAVSRTRAEPAGVPKVPDLGLLGLGTGIDAPSGGILRALGTAPSHYMEGIHGRAFRCRPCRFPAGLRYPAVDRGASRQDQYGPP